MDMVMEGGWLSIKTTLLKRRSIRIAIWHTGDGMAPHCSSLYFTRLNVPLQLKPFLNAFIFTISAFLTLECTLLHFNFLLVSPSSQIDLRLNTNTSFSWWLPNSTLPCLNLLCVQHKANLRGFLFLLNCTRVHTVCVQQIARIQSVFWGDY